MSGDRSLVRILIVDDTENIREILNYHLVEAGYEVVTAGNGADGLTQLEQHEVDGMIVDVMMPDMDGHEFLARARELENGRDVPVIYCSCLADRETVIRAVENEAKAYLMKPFKKQDLLNKALEAFGAPQSDG